MQIGYVHVDSGLVSAYIQSLVRVLRVFWLIASILKHC